MEDQVELEKCSSLDEVRHVAEREAITTEDPDEKAIEKLAETLSRTTSGRSASHERLMQMAEDLYAAFCHRFLTGAFSVQEINRMAELLGEDPKSLQERLTN